MPTIRIELEDLAEHPTGRLVAASGAVREFCGWIALVAAIDAVIERTERTTTTKPDRKESSG